MKLNGITCLGYEEKATGFEAVLSGTTMEEAAALPSCDLRITTDADELVKVLHSFGPVSSVTRDLETSLHTVFLRRLSAESQAVQQLAAENSALRQELNERLAEHADALVELASLIS